MDTNTVIVIGILALVIIVALFIFRKGKGIKASIEGPLNTKLNLDASNPESTPGATVEDARSHGGSITAEDTTGRGASVRRAEAQQDIKATSRGGESTHDPKA